MRTVGDPALMRTVGNHQPWSLLERPGRFTLGEARERFTLGEARERFTLGDPRERFTWQIEPLLLPGSTAVLHPTSSSTVLPTSNEFQTLPTSIIQRVLEKWNWTPICTVSQNKFSMRPDGEQQGYLQRS